MEYIQLVMNILFDYYEMDTSRLQRRWSHNNDKSKSRSKFTVYIQSLMSDCIRELKGWDRRWYREVDMVDILVLKNVKVKLKWYLEKIIFKIILLLFLFL